MSDLGTFKVQSDALRTESKVWRTKATHAATAEGLIAGVVGRGDAFGVMAGSCGVTGNYNAWSAAMLKALQDAERSFDYLEAALVSAANAYDGVDATVATSVQKLDDMVAPASPPAGSTGPSGPAAPNGDTGGAVYI